MPRPCAICAAPVDLNGNCNLTAHEFKCYKLAGRERVPPIQLAEFDATLVWERRSAAAKRGVETRRALGGKRAPRPIRA